MNNEQNPLIGQFSAAEQQEGQDAYQARVQAMHAQTEQFKQYTLFVASKTAERQAKADHQVARTEAMKGLTFTFLLASVVPLLMVYVWLFKVLVL